MSGELRGAGAVEDSHQLCIFTVFHRMQPPTSGHCHYYFCKHTAPLAGIFTLCIIFPYFVQLSAEMEEKILGFFSLDPILTPLAPALLTLETGAVFLNEDVG